MCHCTFLTLRAIPAESDIDQMWLVRLQCCSMKSWGCVFLWGFFVCRMSGSKPLGPRLLTPLTHYIQCELVREKEIVQFNHITKMPVALRTFIVWINMDFIHLG